MTVDVEPIASPTGTSPDGSEDGRTARRLTRRTWSPKRTAIGLGAVVALGAVLVFTSGADDLVTEIPPNEDPPEVAVPSLTGELEDGYVAFSDPETGITLQHPESWVPLLRPEGTRRLLLSAGGDSSFSVRVEPLDGVDVVDTPEELVQVQGVTDRIAGAPGVQVVNREAIELNGMLGIAYLGRFTDEASGTKVANAQYFLFRGNTMYVLLFQAVPEEGFDRLAPDFDKVLASFQGAPIAEGESAPAPAGG